MKHLRPRSSSLLCLLTLCLGAAGPLLVSACAPPASPAKEPEDIAPPGPLEGVEAETMSSSDQPGEADGAPAEAASPSQVKFEDLPAPEKMKFMKTTVLPQMKEVFQAYDAKEFSQFNCGTCHGAGAQAGNFSMPSKDLPALNKAEMDEHPAMSKFMAEQVVPKMAELLGEELEGEHRFGCFACHTKKD